MVKQLFFIIVVIIITLDQITKKAVSGLAADISVMGDFLTITAIKNTGAGFGILQGQRWLLIVLTIGVLIWILYSLKEAENDPVLYYSFALIVGGAVGNLIDRVICGYVIDFISFSFWPAFNVADSAISVGAIGLIYYFVVTDLWKKRGNKARSSTPSSRKARKSLIK